MAKYKIGGDSSLEEGIIMTDIAAFTAIANELASMIHKMTQMYDLNKQLLEILKKHVEHEVATKNTNHPQTCV